MDILDGLTSGQFLPPNTSGSSSPDTSSSDSPPQDSSPLPQDAALQIEQHQLDHLYSSKISYIGAGLDAEDSGTASGGLLDRVGNYITKGIPLTGAAIVNSFANTGIDVGNWFGAGAQKLSIQKEFGEDGSYSDYYNRNTGLVEGGGLLVGSLLPGLGAIKGLKLATATGELGESLSSATGLLSGIKEPFLKQAAQDAAENVTGNSVFGVNATALRKALVIGAGDNIIQGLVYQTATAATMHGSPLLDQTTISDNVKDILESGATFGLIGGGIGAAQDIYGVTKAANIIDSATKAQELVGREGLGNITPGDRILGLVNQRMNTPAPTTVVGKVKAQFAENVFTRDTTAAFSDLAGGDKDLASVFHHYVMGGVVNSGVTVEQLADQIGLLARVGRIDDESIAATSENVKYVNPTVAAAGKGDLDKFLGTPGALFSDTKSALGARAFSVEGVPVVGHALEPIDLLNIHPNASGKIPTLKYSGAKDAYNQGVDLFIDANGGVHINPGSDTIKQVARPGESRPLGVKEGLAYDTTGNLLPGSKKLNTSATFLNLPTGSLSSSPPLSVVGDFAGGVTRERTGLAYAGGKNFFPIKEDGGGEEFLPKSPLEANANFVFHALGKTPLRDIDIHPEDLPRLESVYRSMLKVGDLPSGETYPKAYGIDFSGEHAGNFPQSPDELAAHIQQVKYQKFLDYLGAGNTADQALQYVNAPTTFATQGATKDPASFMVDPISYTKPNNIRLAYDISTTKDQAGNLLRGLQATSYRYLLAKQQNDTAVNKFLATVAPAGKADQYFSGIKSSLDATSSNLSGAGEGLLTAANGGYNTLAQQMERVGRNFNELQLYMHKGINDTLASPLQTLLATGNESKAAEWGNFIAARHSTGESYEFLPDDLAAKNDLPANSAVLQGALTKDAKGNVTDWNPDYLPDGFVRYGSSVTGQGLRTVYPLSKEVADAERASATLLAGRNELRDSWRQAQGLPPLGYDPATLYAPPINTAKFPFFALVKEKEGAALSGTGGVQMMVARNAEELRQKIALLPDHLVAYTKDNVKEFKQAQGEYDFNRNFTSIKVKNDMARAGVLTGLVPEVRGANLVNDIVQFHKNQATALLRDHIELANPKLFAQLDAMGERFKQTASSSVGTGGFGAARQTPDNPYSTYTRTALGVSSKDNYPLWNTAQEKLQAFGNTAFDVVSQLLGGLKKGIVTPEEATRISNSFGLGNPYGAVLTKLSEAQHYGGLANRLPPANILSKVVGYSNAILGKTIIRLDPAQQLVHAATLPIMSSLEYYGASKELGNLLSSTLPGSSLQVPSFARAYYTAIRNYFGANSQKLLDLYNQVGMPHDQLLAHKEMIEHLVVPPGATGEATWLSKIQNAGATAEKISGTKFTNQFNHFLACDIGRQIGDAAGLKDQAMLDHIATFSNRVMGNLSAGQRGAIFHGPVGQAVGLFQAYQFNLLQQLFRHVGEGNYKALAMGAGLQSTMFGLSSLPGFHALNTLIQTHDGNAGGSDLYSNAVRSLGPKVADYLLYGSLSGVTGAALYSRGDLNPRRDTIIPTNPLELPTVSAGIKLYQTIAQMGSNISKGGPVGANLLLALEHNGLSRPLSGLAELVQGFSTDTRGNLLMNSNGANSSQGFSHLFSVANLSRLAGAKPLDEALAMDALYRSNAAKQADQVRMEDLGRAFKSSLYSSDSSTPATLENFAAKYVANGGNINNWNRLVLSWTNEAHTPAANKAFTALGSNQRLKNLQIQMGGVPLPAYQPSQTEEPQVAGN